LFKILTKKSTFQIDNEEYGEALQLARAYGLDCDLVYQRQWRSQKVSVASIHDYLVSTLLIQMGTKKKLIVLYCKFK
jgi:hypothetical protein